MFRRINVFVYIIDTAGIHGDMATKEVLKLTILHFASSVGDKTIINYLLDRKADVNRMSAENRYTPLHYATMKNFPDSIKLLYQAGGNVHVNAREEAATGGEEPLLITAAKYNSRDAAKFLLPIIAGVNPDYQDNDGLTALHYAVEFANLQLTDILVSKGAPVDCQDNWKQTLLHRVFQTDNTYVLKKKITVVSFHKN
jgi:ankyrin repeat protein